MYYPTTPVPRYSPLDADRGVTEPLTGPSIGSYRDTAGYNSSPFSSGAPTRSNGYTATAGGANANANAYPSSKSRTSSQVSAGHGHEWCNDHRAALMLASGAVAVLLLAGKAFYEAVQATTSSSFAAFSGLAWSDSGVSFWTFAVFLAIFSFLALLAACMGAYGAAREPRSEAGSMRSMLTRLVGLSFALGAILLLCVGLGWLLLYMAGPSVIRAANSICQAPPSSFGCGASAAPVTQAPSTSVSAGAGRRLGDSAAAAQAWVTSLDAAERCTTLEAFCAPDASDPVPSNGCWCSGSSVQAPSTTAAAPAASSPASASATSIQAGSMSVAAVGLTQAEVENATQYALYSEFQSAVDLNDIAVSATASGQQRRLQAGQEGAAVTRTVWRVAYEFRNVDAATMSSLTTVAMQLNNSVSADRAQFSQVMSTYLAQQAGADPSLPPGSFELVEFDAPAQPTATAAAPASAAGVTAAPSAPTSVAGVTAATTEPTAAAGVTSAPTAPQASFSASPTAAGAPQTVGTSSAPSAAGASVASAATATPAPGAMMPFAGTTLAPLAYTTPSWMDTAAAAVSASTTAGVQVIPEMQVATTAALGFQSTTIAAGSGAVTAPPATEAPSAAPTGAPTAASTAAPTAFPIVSSTTPLPVTTVTTTMTAPQAPLGDSPAAQSAMQAEGSGVMNDNFTQEAVMSALTAPAANARRLGLRGGSTEIVFSVFPRRLQASSGQRGASCGVWDSSDSEEWCFVDAAANCGAGAVQPFEGSSRSSAPCGSGVESRSAYLNGAEQQWQQLLWTSLPLGFFLLLMGYCAGLLNRNPSKVRAFRKTWEELSQHEIQAATYLGFHEESWNSGSYVPVQNKTWPELTPDERSAVTTLGYTATTWHSGKGAFGADSADDFDPEVQYAAAKQEVVDKLNNNTPQSIKLQVYGYYSQIEKGDCREPEPTADQWERDKWRAWSQHRGMARREAIQRYIALAHSIPSR